MSEFSRRELLRNVALATTLGGVTPAMAQHVHRMAAEDKTASGGVYKPKAFNDHEYRTLQRLADLIIPADEKDPGALAAGAIDWIDLMSSENPDLKNIYTGGVFWLDGAMRHRHESDFLDAKPEAQTAMLDLIAYKKNESPDLGPGIKFFSWARKMVVDAYYTSPIGIKAIGYIGNTAVAKFEIPQEVIDYALKRCPV